MSDRKCPYCGEHVPSFSVTCPKCYKSIHREEFSEKKKETYRIIDDDKAPSVFRVNRKLAMFLALIPAAAGLMGLAQLYCKDYKKGFAFLAIGVLLMLSIVTSAMGIATSIGGAVSVVMMVFNIILFIVVYMMQAFDALIHSVFSF